MAEKDDCRCLTGWISYHDFTEHIVGVDTREGRFGDVSIRTCLHRGRLWLRYQYDHEGFTASGRWWQGPISPEAAAGITAEAALYVLATLPFCYLGGRYRGGE